MSIKNSLKSVALALQQHKKSDEKWKNTREKWNKETPENSVKWKHPRKKKNETPEKGERMKNYAGFSLEKNSSFYLLILRKLKRLS